MEKLIVQGALKADTLDGALMRLELQVIRPHLIQRESLQAEAGVSGSTRIVSLYPRYRVEGAYSPESHTLTYRVLHREDI